MSVFICGQKPLHCGQRTLIMGIINVTPDSFSDGGSSYSTDAALNHGIKLLEEGADVLDIGGVATSPHAAFVDEEEEMKRVLPLIKAFVKEGIRTLSIDTSSAAVAERALDLGASWINDQHAALRDPLMAQVMRRADAAILMHNKGLPGVNAGENVSYDDVLSEVTSFFRERVLQLEAQGIAKEKLIIDPGIGFGKGLKDSLMLINNMHYFKDIAGASLIGVSRKSFLGKIVPISEPKLRDEATLGATAAAIASGANMVRTHNVKATVDMVRVFDACRFAAKSERYEDLH